MSKALEKLCKEKDVLFIRLRTENITAEQFNEKMDKINKKINKEIPKEVN